MKKKKPRLSAQFKKRLLLSVALIALLLFSIHVFVDLFEKELGEMLVKKIEKRSKGLYTINYGSIDLNAFKRSVRINDLSVKSHPEPPEDESKPVRKRVLVTADFTHLELSGISLPALVFKKVLDADTVSLAGSDVKLDRWSGGKQKSRPMARAGSVSLWLSKLKVNLKKLKSTKSPVRFRAGNVTFSDLTLFFLKGPYQLKAATLRITTPGAAVTVDSLRLIPGYEKYTFARNKGYLSNWQSLEVKRVTFTGIDLESLFEGRRFLCRRVSLEYPELDVYRDKNVPRRRRRKRKKFPQQLLRETAYKLNVKDIKISGGRFEYAELPKGGKQPGTLFFDNLNGHIKNVSNDPEQSATTAPMQLKASGRLMGKAVLDAEISMPVFDKNNRFTFSGSLGRMDLRAFNTMLETTAHLRMNRGTLTRLTFSAGADNRAASGEMKCLYKDLKISLLKKSNSHKKRKVVSFLANKILHRSNPKRGKKPRIGRIRFERKKAGSLFNYMWKALLSGLKSSVGLSRKKR